MRKQMSSCWWSACALVVVLQGCAGEPESSTGQALASAPPRALLGGDLIVDGTVDILDGEQEYDNISVINGGELRVTDYDTTGTTGTVLLRARFSITVDGTSSITANAAGHRGGPGSGSSPTAGEGPGAGGAAPNDGGGGGGHAGAGDDGTRGTINAPKPTAQPALRMAQATLKTSPWGPAAEVARVEAPTAVMGVAPS